MPLETPRHSTELHCEVYHNHTDCTEANNIEDRYLKFGTSGKRLCKHCESLGDRDGFVKETMKYKTMAHGLVGGSPVGFLGGISGFFSE